MKKQMGILFILGVILSACIIGCGEKKDTTKDTIVIGTAGCYPPMESIDVKTNQLIGFDIDLMNAVCAEAGLHPEYKVIAFDGLIPALQSKEIDVIACGLTITQQRKEVIAFSDPYFQSGDSLMYWDDQTVNSPEDLSGKSVGVQANSSTHYALEKVSKKLETEGKASIELQMFKTMSDAIAALQIKGVQAIAIDYPMAADYMNTNPDSHFKVNLPFASCDFGMGLRKDAAELVNKINKGLSAIRENGDYDKLLAKYFSK